MNINQFMSPRLLAVADQIVKSQTVADIGTDHAYIPIYLITNKMAKHAIAMDINEGPLFRAEQNIKRFSLEDKIETRLSDGLKNLNNNEADTVVIAGMGGILINNILNNDKARLKDINSFILQPMTAVEETRRYLEQNGFEIENEVLAKEDNKIYTIISAKFGKMEIKNEINYYIGEQLIKNKDKHLKELLEGKIYEYEKAISSMEFSQDEHIKEKINYFQYLINEMKKLVKECAKW